MESPPSDRGLRRRLTAARRSLRRKLWRTGSLPRMGEGNGIPPLPASNSSNALLSPRKNTRTRNQGDVGQSCRGSINLSGATVLRSDESSSAFAVSHATQTFHLKAKDDADRHRWIGRNQGDVGQSCRGSINLSGATVLRSDESSSAFAVSHATQTFHLKAKDDADRHRWIGRNQGDVGQSCRGSINLSGATVLRSDESSSAFAVSHATQTFHLKAKDDADRHRWIGRNQGDVGQSCRGSINLSGATVLRSDESSSAFAVSHATQTFHLKAKDDADRHRWIGRNQGDVGQSCRGSINLSGATVLRSDESSSAFAVSHATQTFHLKAKDDADRHRWIGRNQGDVGQSCRGSINLSGATVLRSDESSSAFAVSHATQTFHLKAKDDADRHRWIAAIELGKLRAQKEADSDEEELMTRTSGDASTAPEAAAAVAALQARLADLHTCQGLIDKHGNSLVRCLAEVERAQGGDERREAQDKLQERVTLFKITASAMMNAGREFVSTAETGARKWEKALAHERQQRQQLQEALEALAKQHRSLEKAAIGKLGGQPPPGDASTGALVSAGPYSDSDEDDAIFQDAQEEVETGPGALKRSGSGISADAMEATGRTKAKLFGARIQATGEPTTPSAQTPKRGQSSRPRRTAIPARPNYSLNLWSVMKNSIGKELSKIPMPVNFNEPLSMVQRLTEDLEYSYLLDDAAKCTDSCEQLAYVAVFTASAYGTLTNRTGKPFNPLLGETYECDRREDLGWRAMTEQVSHHPPAAAQHVEGVQGWKLWQEFTMSSKFRGKYLSVIPLGTTHLEFPSSGHHYTWRKVTTTVHNIIVGKLWIDNHGEMTIENHKTGDKCHLKYIPYSYFSSSTPRKVTGVVTESGGRVRWVVQGTWDEQLEIARVMSEADASTASKPVFKTEPPIIVWRKTPPIPDCEQMYNFTRLAIELNEPEDKVAPTDARRRPDQRLMEEGRWDESNAEKLRVEEKQRSVRRQREAQAEKAMLQGEPYPEYEPAWFRKERDPLTGNLIHVFRGDYWEAKEKQDWARCPDIY